MSKPTVAPQKQRMEIHDDLKGRGILSLEIILIVRFSNKNNNGESVLTKWFYFPVQNVFSMAISYLK